MQKIRLEFMSDAGELDPDENCSFQVNKEDYYDLPECPINDFQNYQMSLTSFEELYRNHRGNPEAEHFAIKLECENKKNLYIVWLEKEELWVAFEFEDQYKDSIWHVVETASPWRSEVWRINTEIAKMIKRVFAIQNDLSEMYKQPPQ